MNSTRSSLLAVGAAAVLALTACGSSDTSTGAPAAGTTSVSSSAGSSAATSSSASTSGAVTSSSSAGSSADADCAAGTLPTKAPGSLTIATSEPAYEPWMVDDDPTNGQGYESAVAYAVATELGFTKDQVSWVRVPFDAVIAPTPKDYDFDINQVSISDERKQAVDFSSGYYDVVQAIVTVKGSPIDGVTTLAGLKGAKLGGMLGTTSLDSIKATIAPTTEPAVFDTNDNGVQALQAGSIDGLVLDLPSALYVGGVQVTDGVVVGQLPATSTDTEQFGLVLDKGSSLTPCVTAAVDALRADGTLDQLAAKWIADTSAPKLT